MSLFRSSYFTIGLLKQNSRTLRFAFNLSTNTQSAMSKERTYIMVKPDGVQRGLVGEIVKRFENRGYKLVALKMASPTKEHLETHYEDLKAKKFFPKLITYMLSGPVVCMVWEGVEAVKIGRVILGATNPQDSNPGTIRGDFCLVPGRNICHGSDSVASANKEIAHWFTPSEVFKYDQAMDCWINEED